MNWQKLINLKTCIIFYSSIWRTNGSKLFIKWLEDVNIQKDYEFDKPPSGENVTGIF